MRIKIYVAEKPHSKGLVKRLRANSLFSAMRQCMQRVGAHQGLPTAWSMARYPDWAAYFQFVSIVKARDSGLFEKIRSGMGTGRY
jgi:hypothetical protein